MPLRSNRAQSPREGGKNDVKISFMDYFYMVDVLRDERVSAETLLKFKHVYDKKMIDLGSAVFLLFPAAAVSVMALGTKLKNKHMSYT